MFSFLSKRGHESRMRWRGEREVKWGDCDAKWAAVLVK